MSRRSLRLDDGVLDRSLPLSSASFSAGGAWRSCRPWQARRPGQLSVSCSESVLGRTPRKLSDASLHSDASLLSTLLDESSVQETTLVDTLWGLDQDLDPKESTVLADTTLAAGDVLGNPVQSLSHVSSRGCEADRRGHDCLSSCGHSGTPTIYCRDSGRRKTARHNHLAAMSLTKSGRDQMERRSDGSLRKMAGGVLGRFRRRCSMTGILSVNRFLLLGLVPLLLFIGLSWFGPPALSLSEWRTPFSVHRPPSSESRAPGGGVEEEAAAGVGGVLWVERSLAALWGRVEAGGRRARQSQARLLRLHGRLRLHAQDRLGRRLERHLARIGTRLEGDRLCGEQVRQLDLKERRSQGSRLERLEQNLRTLAADAQEAKRRLDAWSPSAPPPAAVSVATERQARDALLQKVAELQASLEEVRREVERLSGPDRLQEMMENVRQEAAQLLSRKPPASCGAAAPPALLRQQRVTWTRLRAALASMELRILRNISLRLERRRGQEAEPGGGPHAITEEDVRTVVKDALRLFSQDRTGMADYALESGGGSVLSTRCSQTHRTQAALLSLFGIPLWFFSQSPRTVIQPDVHPGNCWAFSGSRGFLVIRLSMKIHVSAVSVEHMPKALAPGGSLRSAPRDLSVYGLDAADQERGTALGSFTYQEDGEDLQTFPVGEPGGRPFQIIEVQVLSNWGHQEYTCLYRLRVHGSPGAA